MLRDVLFFPKFQRIPGAILIDLLNLKNPINGKTSSWEGRVGLPEAAPTVH
jgi:hypothetical protein